MMGAGEIVRIVLPTTNTLEAADSLAEVPSKMRTFSNRVAPGFGGTARRVDTASVVAGLDDGVLIGV